MSSNWQHVSSDLARSLLEGRAYKESVRAYQTQESERTDA